MIRAATRAALMLAAVTVFVFVVTGLLPEDAAQVAAGQHADPSRISELRAAMGIDRPAWQRFGSWLLGLPRGDLGTSYVDGKAIGPLLWERFGATLLIAVPAWAVAMGLGVLGAVLLGGHIGRRAERAGSAMVAALVGLPDVVLVSGLVLLFAAVLGWLPAVSLIPVGGTALGQPAILVLPVLTLALPATAWMARLLRGPVADIVQRPFVLDAHLRGVSRTGTVVRHVLPHLLAPLAQAAAVLAGGLVAGTTVVESVLAYPGLGQLLATAVSTRDVPVIQAVALLDAAVVLVGVLVADAVTPAGAR